MVKEALADGATCSRLVSDLPMAELPVVEATAMDESDIAFWLMRQRLRVCGVAENGVLCGVTILQTLGDPGGVPGF